MKRPIRSVAACLFVVSCALPPFDIHEEGGDGDGDGDTGGSGDGDGDGDTGGSGDGDGDMGGSGDGDGDGDTGGGGNGSGGQAPSGGVSNTGGTPATGGQAAEKECPNNPALLDDMESLPTQICDHDGRHGYWYTWHSPLEEGGDLVGTVFPEPGNFVYADLESYSGFSATGIHFWTETYYDVLTETVEYAGLATHLKFSESAGRRPYDASKYEGIQFLAMGYGTFLVEFDTVSTEPIQHQGTCVPTDDGFCWDSPARTIIVDNYWRIYELCFRDFASSGLGNVVIGAGEFDASDVLTFGIQPLQPDYGDYILLDDVEFMKTCSSTDS